jgi:pectin methylesterase-like acyl-CoA thioesterase
MDMAYGCTHYDDGWFWSYYWQTLDVSFNGAVLYVESSGICNGNTPCYSTIQGAVNAAGSGSTIKIAGGSYGEDVSLGMPKNLTLKGGYNSTFTTQSSETTFHTMTISNGTAAVDKLELQ